MSSSMNGIARVALIFALSLAATGCVTTVVPDPPPPPSGTVPVLPQTTVVVRGEVLDAAGAPVNSAAVEATALHYDRISGTCAAGGVPERVRTAASATGRYSVQLFDAPVHETRSCVRVRARSAQGQQPGMSCTTARFRGPAAGPSDTVQVNVQLDRIIEHGVRCPPELLEPPDGASAGVIVVHGTATEATGAPVRDARVQIETFARRPDTEQGVRLFWLDREVTTNHAGGFAVPLTARAGLSACALVSLSPSATRAAGSAAIPIQFRTTAGTAQDSVRADVVAGAQRLTCVPWQ